jgi:peptide-methionine (S)-S-oxide reductase
MREYAASVARFLWVLAFLLQPMTAAATGASSAKATAAPPTATSRSASATSRSAPAAVNDLATFAAGCFWCAETAFEGVPGVLSVTSGFSGGPEKNPTYEMVSSGRTGHAEAVHVVFDPKRITYSKLLQIFWHNVDPMQAEGQFCDHGHQYRSAIFWKDETQHRLAEESKRALEASKRFKRPIVTEIVRFTAFYPAEEYHQDYYKKNPEHYHAYRTGCGRDRRLQEIWGSEAPATH